MMVRLGVHSRLFKIKKEILAIEVTTDDMHDSEVLPNLIMNASRHRTIIEACMDGAYDSIKSYRLLGRYGCKAYH